MSLAALSLFFYPFCTSLFSSFFFSHQTHCPFITCSYSLLTPLIHTLHPPPFLPILRLAMQEIEVPPRDVFQHYVHVDQPNKALVWWFSTKRKNISFGLFFRKSSSCPPQLKSNTQAPSITSLTIPSPPVRTESSSSRSFSQSPQTQAHGSPYGLLSSSPTKSSKTSNYASSRASIDTLSDDEDQASELADGQSIHHNQTSSTQPSARRKKTVAKFKDPDLIEILPIQHYNSAAGPVRGEYLAKEEGSYVLVFGKSCHHRHS